MPAEAWALAGTATAGVLALLSAVLVELVRGRRSVGTTGDQVLVELAQLREDVHAAARDVAELHHALDRHLADHIGRHPEMGPWRWG